MDTQVETDHLAAEFKEFNISNRAGVAAETKHRGTVRRAMQKEQNEVVSAVHEPEDSSVKVIMVGNPLVVMAHQLRSELHQFVHASLTQNCDSKVGFNGEAKKVISPNGLAQSVEGMCQHLENYYQRNFIGKQGLDFKVGAHNLQTQLEHFLIMISGLQVNKDVAAPASREVLSAAVQLKTALAEIVIQAQASVLENSANDEGGDADPHSAA